MTNTRTHDCEFPAKITAVEKLLLWFKKWNLEGKWEELEIAKFLRSLQLMAFYTFSKLCR